MKSRARQQPAAKPRPGRTAVMYVRVSSKEQEQGFSIPAQRKLLIEYAEGQHGLNIVARVRRRRDRQTGRSRRVRRDARLPTHDRADLSNHPRRKDRSAVPQHQGLGDGRRSRPRSALRQGRSRRLEGLALIREVHARHQGVDGEELHRQPERGGAKGMREKAEQGHWPRSRPSGT